MIWFALASLTPFGLLTLAALQGGVWVWLALLCMTFCVFALDRIGKRLEVEPSPQVMKRADLLSITLAVGHVVLLLLCVVTVPDLPLPEAVFATVTLGMIMGQISHPNAHELIHRGNRSLRRLGVIVYSTMLIGHHVSAHLRVHHVHVGTDADPNSPCKGEGFYHFWPRAWRGSFLAGLDAENRARQRKSQPPGVWRHPYLIYVGTGLGMAVLAFALSGLGGLLVLLAACIYAHMQLFLSDYVQHYGLRRGQTPSGKPEPVSQAHSWNAPHWYSSAMMLNAPRHSDHHVNPGRKYPALDLVEDMPMLPNSLPVMATIALFPTLWKRIMNPRVERWRVRQGQML